ncbi:MAG: hypothetical protein V2I66_10540 [Halieaceae bacterium]|nr:hypothetical protein [Halieaceae bacterium]
MITAADAISFRIRRLARSSTALVLLLASLPLAAQAPAEPPQQSEAPAEETAPNDDATPLPADDTADAAPTEPEDPFDYEASEQISEDLSVSFPVDI